MTGYGGKTRTQPDVVNLFRENYPESPLIFPQGTVSKIE